MSEALAERAERRNPAGSARPRCAFLQFEKQWWRYAGAKESAVRELFDMIRHRYYQVLNGLLDNPARSRPNPCS
jgi:hypothetical protein